MADENVSVHAPYEDLAIEGLRLIGKLIDGQTPEQKAHIWDGWIKMWDTLLGRGK